MLESFLGSLSPLLMMFLFILIGFILNKFSLMLKSTSIVLSKCEKYIFMPALGYTTFSKYCTISTIYEKQSDAENIKLLHSKGIKVNCWTCDDKETAEKLVSYGVDYITSNILE